MSKVITFSRVFPSYHPRAGEPTYFVEKIWKSIGENSVKHLDVPDISLHHFFDCQPKHHTIRAGNRFKVGDWFSPRVWSGKPYNSKQIQFAPDIQIKKVWDFTIHSERFFIDQRPISNWKGKYICDLAENDGLKTEDLKFWFQYPKEFEGQIICWNQNVEY